jgi:hypothetical protein
MLLSKTELHVFIAKEGITVPNGSASDFFRTAGWMMLASILLFSGLLVAASSLISPFVEGVSSQLTLAASVVLLGGFVVAMTAMMREAKRRRADSIAAERQSYQPLNLPGVRETLAN